LPPPKTRVSLPSPHEMMKCRTCMNSCMSKVVCPLPLLRSCSRPLSFHPQHGAQHSRLRPYDQLHLTFCWLDSQPESHWPVTWSLLLSATAISARFSPTQRSLSLSLAVSLARARPRSLSPARSLSLSLAQSLALARPLCDFSLSLLLSASSLASYMLWMCVHVS
jgi:hypothetical protein